MTKIILLQNTIHNGFRYVAGAELELEEEVAKHFIEAKLGYQPEDVESVETTEQTEVETAGEKEEETAEIEQADGEVETQTEETAEDATISKTETVEEQAEVKQATTAKNGNKKGNK